MKCSNYDPCFLGPLGQIDIQDVCKRMLRSTEVQDIFLNTTADFILGHPVVKKQAEKLKSRKRKKG